MTAEKIDFNRLRVSDKTLVKFRTYSTRFDSSSECFLISRSTHREFKSVAFRFKSICKYRFFFLKLILQEGLNLVDQCSEPTCDVPKHVTM